MTKRQTLRLIFHKDSMILVAALIFLWFTISLLVDSNYTLEHLTKHSGRLTSIDSAITRVKNKPFFKEITKKSTIRIDTEDNYFTCITTKNFGYITSHLSPGDAVTIYTKHRLWGIFGLRNARTITHFTKGNIVLIDFEQYQQSLSGLFMIALPGSVFFFIVCLLGKNKTQIYF